MAAPKLPLNGQNATLTFFVSGAPMDGTANARSFNIDQRSQKHMDKYIGQQRDKLDKQVLGYTFKADLDYVDATIVKALQAIDAARDANKTIPDLSIGIVWSLRNGGREGYIIRKCVGDFKIASAGKDERVRLTIDAEAEELGVLSLP